MIDPSKMPLKDTEEAVRLLTGMKVGDIADMEKLKLIKFNLVILTANVFFKSHPKGDNYSAYTQCKLFSIAKLPMEFVLYSLGCVGVKIQKEADFTQLVFDTVKKLASNSAEELLLTEKGEAMIFTMYQTENRNFAWNFSDKPRLLKKGGSILFRNDN